MLNEIFKILLSMSVSGTLLMLILFLFVKQFRTRLSKSWQYYLWLIVIVRLLVPFSPDTSPMDTLFQAVAGDAGQSLADTAPEMPNAVPASAEGGTPQEGAQSADKAAAPTVPKALSGALQFTWAVWLFVALLLFIRKITIYQSFVKYVQAGCAAVTDIECLEQLGRLMESNQIRGSVELSVNSLVSSPLLIGFFHPRIVLPAVPSQASDFQNIMLHELTHYKRGDMFYKWLVQFTICLHWFNPFVYRMGSEINRSCELSCDEAVIQKLDDQNKRAYGDTLLNAVGAAGVYKDAISSVTLNENKALLRERLDTIMNFKRMNRWMVLAAIVFSVCLFAGGFMLGTYTAKPDSAAASDEQLVFSDEGLPIMNAQNRALYETYLAPIAVSGVLYRNFSPEDPSALLEGDGTFLLTLVNALEQEQIHDYLQVGKVPAAFVNEVLTKRFPLTEDMISAACADLYDADSDAYLYDGGLGGGPAIPVVTGSDRKEDLLAIYYTWYVGDPSADAFRYAAGNDGVLIVDLSAQDDRYLSNKSIPLQ